MTDQSHPTDGQGNGSCACGGNGSCGSTPAAQESPSKVFWRSLDDKNNTAEFERWAQNEFTEGASELEGEDRRTFLKLMGASVALAGATAAGCRRLPEQHLHEYATRPVDRIPGTPVKYATSWDFDGVGRGLLAKSVDGRPIKVDGNPKHPDNRGASDSITQATALEIYDPDRSRTLRHKNAPSNVEAFNAWRATMSTDGLAFLCEPSSSPTFAELKDRIAKKFAGVRFFEWCAVNDDSERQGTEIAFGSPMRPIWNLAAAQVILSLDCDFLMAHPASVRNSREFAAARRVDRNEGKMSRLYMIESALTVTGMNADERIAARSCDIAAMAAQIAKELGVEGITSSDGAIAASDRKIIDALVADLRGSRGLSLVIAGAGQPAAVHALAALMNEALGNVGPQSTVQYAPAGAKGRTATGDMAQLAKAINDGSVKTLVLVGGNPVYDAPADIDFAALMKKVPETVHLSFHCNETSLISSWHIPRAHYLECWGDTRAWDGTIAPQQPLIEPIIARDMGALSPIELLAIVLDEDPGDGLALVRRTWMATTGLSGNAFTAAWRTALSDGVLPGTAWKLGGAKANASAVAAALAALPKPTANAIEVTFAPDAKVHDGRFANSGWLQELPDPVSKLTWDNAAYMSLALGARLGVTTGDMVRVKTGKGSIESVAWLMPGMADNSVRLHLGYGRKADAAGAIAADAGFNVYPLRTSDAMSIAQGATVEKTGTTYPLAHTQDHGVVEALKPDIPREGTQERLHSIIRENTLKGYHEDPDFAQKRLHVAHRLSLWEETNLDTSDNKPTFRWAMAIDLTACSGCSACVTACQAENNIQIVGKEQVMRGREMHWIRIDRYFKGADQAKPVSYALQPMACQHCENAPCEQVCPVAATVHDKDGLNLMVYNRCIGTRYCSNNCPYKVRRFNFFDYGRKIPARETGAFVVDSGYYFRDFHEGTGEWEKMQFNPDVTVRSRGVMEKCTFCIQRIQEAKIKNKNAWAKAGGTEHSPIWSIPDGQITPACAEACPAQAIVFGDWNDKESKVRKLHDNQRAYGVLEELNTKPRIKYLAKVRNPSASEEMIRGAESGESHPSGHPAGPGTETHDHPAVGLAARIGEVLA